MTNETETRRFNVSILTPFLNGNILRENERYGLRDARGATDIRKILDGFVNHGGGIYVKKSDPEIVLDLEENHDYRKGYKGYFMSLRYPPRYPHERESDLYIIGQDNDSFSAVSRLSDSGILFASFSIYYRKEGEGMTPCKYAFDIPKSRETALAFITDSNIARAILEQDPQKIRMAVRGLNERAGFSEPIIVTSGLERCMEFKKSLLRGKRI